MSDARCIAGVLTRSGDQGAVGQAALAHQHRQRAAERLVGLATVAAVAAWRHHLHADGSRRAVLARGRAERRSRQK
jgi:hypothetical protein